MGVPRGPPCRPCGLCLRTLAHWGRSCNAGAAAGLFLPSWGGGRGGPAATANLHCAYINGALANNTGLSAARRRELTPQLAGHD